MRSDSPGRRPASRLFAVYAAASLVPVVALGALLAATYRGDATRAGVAEARSQAGLLADDVVSPIVGSAPLVGKLPTDERTALATAFARAKDSENLLRLRLRDTTGTVIWSDDGSGFSSAPPEDEVIDALHGEVVSSLKRLNSDAEDVGPLGPRVVEIYRPIMSDPSTGADARPIGVLEMYVPYQPIAKDVDAGLRRMYTMLAIGLSILWVVLALISVSTTKRLRRQSQRLAYLAHYDEAFGLLNRVGFGDVMARRVAQDPDHPPVLALVDVARFHQINKALGRDSGDAVLLELGRRLVAAAGNAAVVGRLGGDEFAVACFAHNGENLDAWAAGLQTAATQPIEAAGVPVLVEVAVGYDHGLPGQPVDELLNRADVALLRAKSAVDRRAGYSTAADEADASSLALMARLRDSIPAGELELHYQPKTSLLDGRVVSVEALVRWRGGGTLLMPQAFLPSAEQTALIHPLTDWVAREALHQLAVWDRAADGIEMAINVSARNLSDPGFADRLLSIVRESQVDAHRLTVEITETALLADPDAARESLHAMHAAGISVSIDDFGQGQTSLAYLASLPVDELKIDRAFVAGITTDATQDAIVRSLVQLGHSLGLRVVAEGIEDEETMERLADLGADIGQGYFIARPMQPGAFDEWRRQREQVGLRAAR
jgi:diguanylate cyclase (GGDEF)-like protein